MRTRCLNPNYTGYQDYGGRGVTICARWMKFENFLADMGTRPNGSTLDRRDNTRGYEPGNCVWSTPKQQRANQRPPRARKLVSGKSIREWANEWGVCYSTARDRIQRQESNHG